MIIIKKLNPNFKFHDILIIKPCVIRSQVHSDPEW